MDDLDPNAAAAFDAAHAKLEALRGHADVQALVARLVGGLLTIKQFLAALFSLPQVRTLVESVDAGAGAGVAALVAGATGPLGPVLGPGAGALVTLGLNAVAHRFENTPIS